MAIDFNPTVGRDSITIGKTLSTGSLEPRTSSSFGTVLKNMFTSVLGRVGIQNTGIDPQYAALIDKQMEVQEQMQLVSLYSNIIKSEHETQMAAVRNVRVG